MAKAIKVKLLSFTMKDKPGLLSEITERLANAKISITAICAYTVEDTAYFDLTTENNTQAKKALKGPGLEFEEENIIQVEMPNKAGELDKVAKILADKGINIEYIYGTTLTGKSGSCLFSTSDNAKALKLINK
ncbi:MAG TPA: ACT domain-containing protein [Dissulfurispiraceae bacterium]|nr:ACT domain-containing protein [Dissulfurispiraceae bacterium]